MDSARWTQGTKAYLAAQAILRGETDSHKIATDVGTSLKNVQNVKSAMKRLMSGQPLPSSLTSRQREIIPAVSSASSASRDESQPPLQPVATPPYRKPATAPQMGSEEEKEDFGNDGNEKEESGNLGKERNMQELREDSREGNGREFLRFPLPWEFPGGNFPAWEDFFPVGILPWEARVFPWETVWEKSDGDELN